jgi:hypothetical protein
MNDFTESIVEDAALAWLNPDLPAEALDDPYQVTFTALHDTPLPKLLSGEICIHDAAKLVEAKV